MDKVVALFKSRRAWAVVAGILLVILHQGLGIDEATATKIVVLIGSWVIGDSLHTTA
jgi:hypothetical protein